MKKRMFGTLLVFCLSVVLFGFVFCGTAEACPNPEVECPSNSYWISYKNDLEHHLRCAQCDYELDEKHFSETGATCTTRAICKTCKKEYGTPLGHTYDKGVVTKPTCFTEGYTTYTCKDCDHKLVTEKVKPLSHWYAEWEPAGSGSNSAPCKRENCEHIKTTKCVDWSFKLVPAGAEEAEDYCVCPVCGALSDGGRLELVEDAKPTPITGWTPEGDMVLRYGALENGEKIICVGFEFDARLVQCTGRTEFTVPAELLEGYQLMLLDADGGETELTLETEGEQTTFELDFSADARGHRTLVRILHLVPVEE